jgi:cell fate regulator YaaT (PSP1 superfamily)
MSPVEFKFCQKKIKEHKLLMKLASVEHLFGTKKIIFYFLANGRVDFRELVKDLAKEYQARIEMKQIGVRDEARLLADYEHCGRELCCRSFLKNLEPVTMKMAKNQKATLDPSKISGRCGRLMCCLRYEDKVYEDLKHVLPKKGSIVKTAKGVGEVINYDVLQQQVTIELENKNKIHVSVKEITDKVREPLRQKEPMCDQPCEKDCSLE